MKVIIAGSRNGVTYQKVCEAIEQCGWDISEVVCGKAYGADTFGEQWALTNKIPIKYFPAKWDDLSHPNAVIRTNKFGHKYDVTAGFRRNHEMGDYADALLAVWDGSSHGTKDMIDYATKKGLKVFVWTTKTQKD